MRVILMLGAACVTALTGLLVVACAAPPLVEPAAASAREPAWPYGAMVSAANPYAVEAAARVLSRGGHAVDAAIAAHAVLGLVEPQSSGLGGGGFMLVFERASGDLTVFDGRETAPAGTTPDMFIRDGEAMGFLDAWQSGVAVGVPGMVALYGAAHEAHGMRPWAELFRSAIELAEEGFEVSPRLNDLLGRVARVSLLDDNPDTAAYFYPGGEPLPIGYQRRNAEYAATLRRITEEGPDAMYHGTLAVQIAQAAQAGPRGGTLTVRDLAGYEVKVREPVCGPYRDYTICTAPPPSSGLAQIAIANLYDHLQQGAAGGPSMAAFVDAQRLAYADRDHYVADPDFVDVPTDDLISPAYLKVRAGQRFAPDERSTPGDPGLVLRKVAQADRSGRDTTAALPGTTHLSIIDVHGNAVALTASVEAPFGSSRWVGGFLLNNELTDFAREPDEQGRLSANAPAPFKRPRSSMSPMLAFDADNRLVLVNGSPGGNSIVAYVAKTTLGILAWRLGAREAIDLPNVVARGDTVRVETADEAGEQIVAELQSLGYTVQARRGENSGLHVIVVREDGLEGGADPRREGEVRAVASGHGVAHAVPANGP